MTSPNNPSCPGRRIPDAPRAATEHLDQTDAFFTARGISVGYGDRVIQERVDLEITCGGILALTGENGSGKSTLLRGLAGLQPLTGGDLTLGGDALRTGSIRHRNATFAIMDADTWMRDLTVADHLHLLHRPGAAGPARPLPGTSLSSPADALTRLALTDLADRLPHTLSSGQKQRAALATALVRPWEILFLDEPEARLDEHYRAVLAELLLELAPGRAILLATHSSELIERVGARTLHLETRPNGGSEPTAQPPRTPGSEPTPGSERTPGSEPTPDPPPASEPPRTQGAPPA